MFELLRQNAVEVVTLLERGEVSPLELVNASLDRIEEVDGTLNAVPIRFAERARARAKLLMTNGIERTSRGWLAGLPVVIKDLHELAGERTTFGSPIFKDHVSTHTSMIVERLERCGAIVVGKSNTPEFGAGANTFNEVFGKTRNPFNTALTCGGSSGGSAVALASGMAYLGTGTDLGGSLRTPAAFCGVVGMRPSLARVPRGPAVSPFQTLDVDGPMARSVSDIALAMDAIAGRDDRDPLSFDAPAIPFADMLKRVDDRNPIRVGFSKDLGGITAVDPEVSAICEQAVVSAGWTLSDDIPDFSSARDIFGVLRAALYVVEREPLLEEFRDALKPEVIWNIEKGKALTASQIAAVERKRSSLIAAMARFFENHDLLVCPAAIVPPFDVDQRYLERLGDHTFPSYIDWLTITYAITITGCPAISVPCGLTESGLPVGLQLVGKPRDDTTLLRFASIMEASVRFEGKAAADGLTVWG